MRCHYTSVVGWLVMCIIIVTLSSLQYTSTSTFNITQGTMRMDSSTLTLSDNRFNLNKCCANMIYNYSVNDAVKTDNIRVCFTYGGCEYYISPRNVTVYYLVHYPNSSSITEHDLDAKVLASLWLCLVVVFASCSFVTLFVLVAMYKRKYDYLEN